MVISADFGGQGELAVVVGQADGQFVRLEAAFVGQADGDDAGEGVGIEWLAVDGQLGDRVSDGCRPCRLWH